MEQDKNIELQEQPLHPENTPETDADTTAPQEPDEEAVKAAAANNRRREIVQLAAGAYLLYTAYQLIMSFVNEFGTQGWTGEMILCIVGAVVFIGAGGYFFVSRLLRILRRYTRKD